MAKLPFSMPRWLSPEVRARAAALERYKASLLPSLAIALHRAGAPTLDSLGAARFPALEESLRAGTWRTAEIIPARVDWVRELNGLAGTPAEIEAQLFVAASAANGYLREAAIRALSRHPGRTALAILLIRCHDWVPEVRTAALSQLIAMLPGQGQSLVSLLDLFVMLTSRRSDPGFELATRLESRLLAPDLRDTPWHALRHAAPASRRFMLSLVARADPARLSELCALAIGEREPSVSRWGLETALANLPTDEVMPLLELAMRHPQGSIRASALRHQARLDPEGFKTSIEAKLFDVSGAVRSAAANIYRIKFGGAALHRWRECVDAGGPAAALALNSLADQAQVEDAERLRPWLRHERSRLRAAALRGLVRTQAADRVPALRRGLLDPSTRVRRQARALASAVPGSLDADYLAGAFASTDDAAIQASLVAASRQLDKWQALALLLTWIGDKRSFHRQGLADELSRWLMREMVTFTPLAPALRERLGALVKPAKSVMPGLAWDRLQYILDQA